MDGYGPTEVDLSGGREFDLGQFGLVLVLDLTDDLLDHIFEGQDPGGSPELVDDDGHMERSEEHTSELQSRGHLVCRLLLEKKNNTDMEHLLSPIPVENRQQP